MVLDGVVSILFYVLGFWDSNIFDLRALYPRPSDLSCLPLAYLILFIAPPPPPPTSPFHDPSLPRV